MRPRIRQEESQVIIFRRSEQSGLWSRSLMVDPESSRTLDPAGRYADMVTKIADRHSTPSNSSNRSSQYRRHPETEVGEVICWSASQRKKSDATQTQMITTNKKRATTLTPTSTRVQCCPVYLREDQNLFIFPMIKDRSKLNQMR